MKTSNIFWGILFLALGVLALLSNLIDVNIDWGSAWKYWPFVLVLIGLSILIKNKIGKVALAAFAAIVLAFTIFATVNSGIDLVRGDLNFVFNDDENGTVDSVYYSEEYSDSIRFATFHLDAGAGKFTIDSSSTNLIDVYYEGKSKNYTFTKWLVEDKTNIQMKMKSSSFNFGSKKAKNKVDVALNSSPIWSLNFDVGAASLFADLSSYRIQDIDIDMGAAALNLIIGEPEKETYIKIDAGASDIDINIPKNAACEIKLDAALSSKNFEDLNEISSNLYRSENYEQADKKIKIKIDCGVSSISLRRY